MRLDAAPDAAPDFDPDLALKFAKREMTELTAEVVKLQNKQHCSISSQIFPKKRKKRSPFDRNIVIKYSS